MARPTVLALMAHPDDAEFLCAGTLIRLAAAGWDVHVATLTPGDCGTMTEDRWAISARRTAEARAAAAVIGATYHCLDERDGLVVYDKPTLQKSFDLFRRVAPQLVFIHTPLDYMMDHVMASQLGRAASFIYGAPNISALPLRKARACRTCTIATPWKGSIRWASRSGRARGSRSAGNWRRRPKCWPAMPASGSGCGPTTEPTSTSTPCAAMPPCRGREAGVAAAEAFVQHRGHAYPKNDLLAELFGDK